MYKHFIMVGVPVVQRQKLSEMASGTVQMFLKTSMNTVQSKSQFWYNANNDPLNYIEK